MKILIVLSVLCGVTLAVRRIPSKGALPASSSPRIVGGTDAEPGEFPFQVSLRHIENGRHTCGGSILSSRYVLTAAHCVYDNGVLFIVTDTVTLSDGGTRYDIEEVIIHENYEPDNNAKNDIALLRTKDDIKLGGNVAVALLPTINTDAGVKVNVSGWGLLHGGDTDPPDHLQKLNDWPIVSHEECSNVAGYDIFDVQICAGEIKGIGVCNGDSGSPLSQNGAVIGLAVFVMGSCGAGYPDVFTRVYPYVDWIVGKTGQHSQELKFF